MRACVTDDIPLSAVLSSVGWNIIKTRISLIVRTAALSTHAHTHSRMHTPSPVRRHHGEGQVGLLAVADHHLPLPTGVAFSLFPNEQVPAEQKMC